MKNNKFTFNFNAPVGQHIEHADVVCVNVNIQTQTDKLIAMIKEYGERCDEDVSYHVNMLEEIKEYYSMVEMLGY